MAIDADGTEAETARPSKRQRKLKSSLPWINVPIAVAPDEAIALDEVRGLHPALCDALRKNQVSSFFPVQAAAWHSLAGGMSSRHDLCIAAPTGSGKTLAYLVPLLQRIAEQPFWKGVRAVIIVPTRALAQQVFEVLSSLGKLLPGFSAALINGSCSVQAEAAAISTSSTSRPTPSLPHLLSAPPALHPTADFAFHQSAHRILFHPADHPGDHASSSAPSILVATPGRLVHHLTQRGNQWLQHLDTLIVDEADRLLRQDYQGWLSKLMAALHSSSTAAGHRLGSSAAGLDSRRVLKLVTSATITHDPAKLSRLQLHAPRYIAIKGGTQRTELPPTLLEYQVTTSATQKPHALVALLRELLIGRPDPSAPPSAAEAVHAGPSSVNDSAHGSGDIAPHSAASRSSSSTGATSAATSDSDAEDVAARAASEGVGVVSSRASQAVVSSEAGIKRRLIVFLSSVEAAHRVVLLLQSCDSMFRGSVAEFSSRVSTAEQQAARRGFEAGDIRVLVASDALTRGMDFEGVDCVVNYDMPAHAHTYIHRAGRTARAGSAGTVITLLRKEHAGAFKALMRKVGSASVEAYRIGEHAWDAVAEDVDAAMRSMHAALLEADTLGAKAP